MFQNLRWLSEGKSLNWKNCAAFSFYWVVGRFRILRKRNVETFKKAKWMLGLTRYVSRRAPSNVFLAMWPRVSGHALQSVFRCSSFIRLSVWLLFQTILPDALSCESFLVGWVFCKNLRTAYIARVSWNNIHELFLLVLHVWSTTLDVSSIAFLDLIKTFLLDISRLLYQQFIWMWLVFLLRFLTSPSPNSTECPNSHW